jgi:hypothetical protein
MQVNNDRVARSSIIPAMPSENQGHVGIFWKRGIEHSN